MFSGYTLRAMALAVMAFVGIALAAPAAAQTIVSPQVDTAFNTGPLTFAGSSFRATVTGTVTTIRVRAAVAGTTDLYLYNGSTTGQFNGAGTPAVTQLGVTLTNRSFIGGYDEFVLSTPLPVTADYTYAFAFGAGQFFRNQSNTYADGTPFFSGNQTSTSDWIFEVVQVPAAPVPTLSEWAMILLGLMLAGGAAIYIQRRQLAA
ncbi:MAG: IPTL-CTERM sorting domain-containing protein [Caulobacteraceae bacterium]|nr:IPTL-CTERM sorting domain-containing protein [Caulobacteraceae bacterium]